MKPRETKGVAKALAFINDLHSQTEVVGWTKIDFPNMLKIHGTSTYITKAVIELSLFERKEGQAPMYRRTVDREFTKDDAIKVYKRILLIMAARKEARKNRLPKNLKPMTKEQADGKKQPIDVLGEKPKFEIIKKASAEINCFSIKVSTGHTVSADDVNGTLVVTVKTTYGKTAVKVTI